MSQDTFEGTYVLRFQLTLKKSQSVSPKNRVPEQKTVPHDQPISTPRKKGFPISDSHMFGMDGQVCFPAFRIWRERAMPAFRVVSTAWENPEKSWLVLIAGLLEHGPLLTRPLYIMMRIYILRLTRPVDTLLAGSNYGHAQRGKLVDFLCILCNGTRAYAFLLAI